MAWRRPGDKPLSETILASLLTHICVTRSQLIIGKLTGAAILQTTFSNSFSGMKIVVLWSKIHWNLIPMPRLTKNKNHQHWSNNGLASNRRQAIIWTSEDTYICHKASMSYHHLHQPGIRLWPWASCQIRKIADAHAPGMPGTFSPSPQVSDPDMHHGTCVTHVPWCMPGSLTSGFLWNWRRGETFPAFPAHAQPAIFRIW